MNDKLKKKKSLSAEHKIISELLFRGYEVSKPVSDDSRYDLVIEKDGAFERAQVKTAAYKRGAVKFKTASVHFNSEGSERRDYKGDIDYFLVYCRKTDEVYKVDIGDDPKVNMTLRVEEPESKYTVRKQINWAEDYLFSR